MEEAQGSDSEPHPRAGDSLSALPAHLAAQVLSLLPTHRDCAAAASVCRRWRQVVQEEVCVWAASYGSAFPVWGSEPVLRPAGPTARALASASWAERCRWRQRIDRAWSGGKRRLEHVLSNHEAWLNALRLVPGAGVASGGSEGAVNFWGLDGELLLHDASHSQAVWALDASTDLLASGAMDGWLHVLDLHSGQHVRRLPVGWRGGGDAPAPGQNSEWELSDVVTTVQLLPGGACVLAGCMDGALKLHDLRLPGATAALRCAAWPQPGEGEPPGAGTTLFWWRRGQGAGGPARLCAARCHGHLVAAGGSAAAVALLDLRAPAAGPLVELPLPSGGAAAAAGRRSYPPSVFTMDLLWPRLAAGGGDGLVQVWDLSRLGATPEAPFSLAAEGSGASGASTPRQEQQRWAAAQRREWPSPGNLAAQQPTGSLSPGGHGSSPAALGADSLLATNDGQLQQGGGLQMGCVYGVKLCEDWRVLSADHAGYVRCWRLPASGGPAAAAAAGGGGRALSAADAFAPSVDDPCSALIDHEGGAHPVGMHALDACLTHLAVAGRDSVVRLYSMEEGGAGDDAEEEESESRRELRLMP